MNIFKLAKKQVGRQKINYHTKSISNLKLIFFPDFDKLKQSQSFFSYSKYSKNVKSAKSKGLNSMRALSTPPAQQHIGQSDLNQLTHGVLHCYHQPPTYLSR